MIPLKLFVKLLFYLLFFLIHVCVLEMFNVHKMCNKNIQHLNNCETRGDTQQICMYKKRKNTKQL